MPANNAPAAFSFVPQQSAENVAKTNRKFINSHLSKVAARKRSHGAAGRLQRKVILPAKQSDRPKVAIERLTAVSRGGWTCPDEERSTCANSCKDADEAVVLRGKVVVIPRAKPALTFITTVLGTGGTDPFQATLIPIDTTVRKLLGFETEVFFPWSAGIEKGADKDGAFRNKFAQIISEAFNDPCTGYANLARLAAMTATVMNDPCMAAIALKYKGLAYQYMRESIAARADNDQANELAMTQMFSLMSMEVADGNSESSTVHSKALLRMMIHDRDTQNALHVKPSKLLNAVLWHECVRGGNTLRQYVFDPSQLIDHAPVLTTLSTAKQKLFSLGYWPHQPIDQDDGFKRSGLPGHLISLVLEIRFLTDMNAALTYAPHLIDDDLMSAYGHHASHLCSKLLGVAHAAERFISNSNKNSNNQHQHQNQHHHPTPRPSQASQQQQPTDERRHAHHFSRTGAHRSHVPSSPRNCPSQPLPQAHTTRAIALAAQFALRVVTSHEAVDLPPLSATGVAAQLFAVYGTQERVLGELRGCWEGCFGGLRRGWGKEREGFGDVGERGERSLWLWILWVGTLAERAEGWLRARGLKGSKGNGGGGAERASVWVEGWFDEMFVRHALGMGLRGWEEATGVLRRYIYFERNTWRSREMFEEGVRRTTRSEAVCLGVKWEEI